MSKDSPIPSPHPQESQDTVGRPALTYARSTDPLMALSPPENIKTNRSVFHRVVHVNHWPKPLRIGLTCLCVAGNTLTANGVYAWPQYGVVIIKKLGLTAAEGQTIVIMGICGTYLMAAPLGSLCDKKGPRFASFVSACLAAAGYGIFTVLLQHVTPGTPSFHIYLGLCYFLVGMAAVGSYFAALTTASLSFPHHPTVALSLPLSAIGLSSLFLSSIARAEVFNDTTTNDSAEVELDAVKYLSFLAIMVPCVNIFSSLFMRILPSDEIPPDSPAEETSDVIAPDYADSPAHLLDPTEHTPLLIGGPEALYAAAREESQDARRKHLHEAVHVHWNVRKLLKNPGFWSYGLIIAVAIGPAEMILSSIGSILTSLLPPESSHLISLLSSSPIHPKSPLALLSSSPIDSKSPLALRSHHILILSLSSTIARLLSGAIADYLSPIVTPPEGSRRLIVKRSTLAAACVAVLLGVYVWGAVGMTSERGLWLVSAGVGSMYGAVFTLTPAITSKHYGPAHFGLAWGMISYFSALGSVIFSYIFGFVYSMIAAKQGDTTSDETSPTVTPPTMCYGVECFRPTFVASAVAAVMAIVGLLMLGKRWKL